MLRIKREKLIKKDGKYYYNHELFNGVIFYIKYDTIKYKRICKNGKIEGDYANEYFDNDFTLNINKDSLEIPIPKIYRNETPRYYNGKPFTGIVYKFIDGFCVEEIEYRDGAGADNIDYYEKNNYSRLCSIHYFKSGSIKEFKRKDKNLLQEIEWYENGNIKYIYIDEDNTVWFEFSFREDGSLTLIEIDEYFEEFEKIKKKIKFNILLNRKELLNRKLNCNISFGGDDVDDNFLYEYYNIGSINNVQQISFSSTSISEKGYEVLLKMPNLKKLHMHDCKLPLKTIDVLKKRGVEVKIN